MPCASTASTSRGSTPAPVRPRAAAPPGPAGFQGGHPVTRAVVVDRRAAGSRRGSDRRQAIARENRFSTTTRPRAAHQPSARASKVWQRPLGERAESGPPRAPLGEHVEVHRRHQTPARSPAGSFSHARCTVTSPAGTPRRAWKLGPKAGTRSVGDDAVVPAGDAVRVERVDAGALEHRRVSPDQIAAANTPCGSPARRRRRTPCVRQRLPRQLERQPLPDPSRASRGERPKEVRVEAGDVVENPPWPISARSSAESAIASSPASHRRGGRWRTASTPPQGAPRTRPGLAAPGTGRPPDDRDRLPGSSLVAAAPVRRARHRGVTRQRRDGRDSHQRRRERPPRAPRDRAASRDAPSEDRAGRETTPADRPPARPGLAAPRAGESRTFEFPRWSSSIHSRPCQQAAPATPASCQESPECSVQGRAHCATTRGSCVASAPKRERTSRNSIRESSAASPARRRIVAAHARCAALTSREPVRRPPLDCESPRARIRPHSSPPSIWGLAETAPPHALARLGHERRARRPSHEDAAQPRSLTRPRLLGSTPRLTAHEYRPSRLRDRNPAPARHRARGDVRAGHSTAPIRRAEAGLRGREGAGARDPGRRVLVWVMRRRHQS